MEILQQPVDADAFKQAVNSEEPDIVIKDLSDLVTGKDRIRDELRKSLLSDVSPALQEVVDILLEDIVVVPAKLEDRENYIALPSLFLGFFFDNYMAEYDIDPLFDNCLEYKPDLVLLYLTAYGLARSVKEYKKLLDTLDSGENILSSSISRNEAALKNYQERVSAAESELRAGVKIDRKTKLEADITRWSKTIENINQKKERFEKKKNDFPAHRKKAVENHLKINPVNIYYSHALALASDLGFHDLAGRLKTELSGLIELNGKERFDEELLVAPEKWVYDLIKPFQIEFLKRDKAKEVVTSRKKPLIYGAMAVGVISVLEIASMFFYPKHEDKPAPLQDPIPRAAPRQLPQVPNAPIIGDLYPINISNRKYVPTAYTIDGFDHKTNEIVVHCSGGVDLRHKLPTTFRFERDALEVSSYTVEGDEVTEILDYYEYRDGSFKRTKTKPPRTVSKKEIKEYVQDFAKKTHDSKSIFDADIAIDDGKKLTDGYVEKSDPRYKGKKTICFSTTNAHTNIIIIPGEIYGPAVNDILLPQGTVPDFSLSDDEFDKVPDFRLLVGSTPYYFDVNSMGKMRVIVPKKGKEMSYFQLRVLGPLPDYSAKRHLVQK